VGWRDVAAVAINVAPRSMIVTACHGEERTVIGLLAQAVSQNLLANRRKSVTAFNPFTHFSSPTKKGLGFAVVVILLDLDRGGSSIQQEHRKPKPSLPSIH
jgi:hypothetical protein